MKNIYYIVLFFLFWSCNSLEESISITQTETDRQVVLVYHPSKEVFRLCMPFDFEFKNNSFTKRRAWGFAYKFNDNDSYLKRKSGMGSGNIYVRQKINGELVEGGIKPYRKRDAINRFQTREFITLTPFELDTSQVVKDIFGDYIQKMQEQNEVSMEIGTMQEFTQRYPDIARELLEGDSISVNIYDTKGEWLTVIRIPIQY